MRSAEAKSLTIQIKADKASASWHIPDTTHNKFSPTSPLRLRFSLSFMTWP